MLVKQDKTTLKSPYDPQEYTVVNKDKGRLTLARDGKVKVRNKNKVKVVQDRPDWLQLRKPVSFCQDMGSENE